MAQAIDRIIRDIEGGRCTLGIEYGSTRIKAVLDDSDENPIAIGTFGWENSFVDGYWTYPESELLNGIQAAYASLKSDVWDSYGVTLRRLGAMGVSAMMHGYLPLDADGRLLTGFRTWRNTTAAAAARELSELFGLHIPERWSVSHLYQAVIDGEEHVADIDFLTTLAGYAHWRLTGQKVLSVGDASGMFPIDSTTKSYDQGMIQRFDGLLLGRDIPWRVEDLLPNVLVAGEVAGHLTEEGASLLDAGGDLEPGCPLCPPEGDAGTGMIATNSVSPRTGNVSAGTSIFSMVVLEGPLRDPTTPTIDLVTTPAGDPVAMVHCNNCSSDINGWVSLFMSYSKAMGISVEEGDAYAALFNAALDADRDAGGLVSLPFVSPETIMGVRVGQPLFVRRQGARFSLGNFMRACIMAAFGALVVGNEALKAEDVRIDRLCAHGGIFRTPRVAQSILAAALEVPVSVMSTAGEGGAWGQALAASYMLNKKNDETLVDFLDNRVFAMREGVTLEPDPADIAGYRSFLADFKRVNEAGRAVGEGLG